MSSNHQTQLVYLHQQIIKSFNLAEIRELCFILDIRYEDLPGDTLSLKTQSLLEHFSRRNQILFLVTELEKQRPHSGWDTYLPAEPHADPPFKGLQYFTEEDAHLFFGRDVLVAELVEQLHQHQFLAVVGASGSGKSSVVQAGLIPAIRKGEIELNGQKSKTWLIHCITPGDAPLKALAASLTRDFESVTAITTLIDDMRTNTQSLELWLYRKLNEQNTQMLLVIDQFEELFTQCNDQKERQQFIDNLVNATKHIKQGRLILVLTLRADFYGNAVQYPTLVPLLEKHQKIVEGMTWTELREAIEGPINNSNWKYESGLVDMILTDVGASDTDQPEPGALPLLSHALLETWKRRESYIMTLDGYQAVGGVKGAIATTADRVYEQLTLAEKEIVHNVSLRLTELGEGKEDTRRRATWEELTGQSQAIGEVHRVLTLLADARLVTTRADGVEVAHEALIREWPMLRRWLEDNREWLRWQRLLTKDAQTWITNERDGSYLYQGMRLMQAREWTTKYAQNLNVLEREFLEISIAVAETQEKSRRRTKNFLITISILLFVIMGILTVLARQGQAAAVRQRRLILAQSLATEALRITERTNDTEVATLLIIEALHLNQIASGNLHDLIDGSLREVLDSDYFNVTLRGHEGIVESVAFSPSGQTLASSSEDNSIRVWNLADPNIPPIVLVGHQDVIKSVIFSPDGKYLASAGADRTIRLWALDNSIAPVVLIGHDDRIRSIVFSPDGSYIVSASDDKTVRIWDLKNPSIPPLILSEHGNAVRSVAFSPNGKYLASGSADRTIRLWNMADLSEPIAILAHSSGIWSVAFSPDGNHLAAANSDGTVQIWTLFNLDQPFLVLDGHEDIVRTVAFSPDGKFLASGSEDHTIRLWNLTSPGEPTVFTGLSTGVSSVIFSPDSQILASANGDHTVRLWYLHSSSAVISYYEAPLRDVAFSPDGQELAIGDINGTVWLQNSENLTSQPTPLTGHTSEIRSIAYSLDGKLLFSASDDKTVRIWNLENLNPTSTILTGHEDAVRAISVSPDGQLIASASSDGTIRLWNVSNLNSEPIVLIGHLDPLTSLAFGPKSHILASAGSGGSVYLWDLTSPGKSVSFVNEGQNWSVAFKLDEKFLASAGSDKIIRLWDVTAQNTNPILINSGHEDTILFITFSPDGQILASASSDRTIRLRDLSDPNNSFVTTILSGHEDNVRAVAFSPDGKTLASVSADSSLRLWITDTDMLVEDACRKVRRNLTKNEWERYLPGEEYRQTCPNWPNDFASDTLEIIPLIPVVLGMFYGIRKTEVFMNRRGKLKATVV